METNREPAAGIGESCILDEKIKNYIRLGFTNVIIGIIGYKISGFDYINQSLMRYKLHHHLSNPNNFLPRSDNSAVSYFVFSQFLGSPGKAYPSGACLSFHEFILH